MASTRTSSRSRSFLDSYPDIASPHSKRRKSESPVISTLTSESALSHDENAMFEPIDNDISDFTEEIVVTIDHIDDAVLVEDSLQTCDSLTDPLSLVQTASSAIGGQLLSDDIIDSDKPTSIYVFKDPTFVHSSKGPGSNKRTRVWKNLKQIISAERALPWNPDDVTYGSIDAPPSFKPAKKYSDISGLEAKYTDPQTKMRYVNADEYRRVRMLPGDIIAGCLHLRKANTLVP
jgi:INO80 complex subunit C